MEKEAKTTKFEFRGVQYKSLVDYCEKKYLDRIEVLSFRLKGDTVIQVVERHFDFYLLRDIEFFGLTFDSLDHLFFALNISYKKYLEYLDKSNLRKLLFKLDAEYKEKNLRPLVVKGKKYLTYKNASFELGLPEKRIMLTATCSEQELYLSDCHSEMEYIKTIKANCKKNGVEFNSREYKLPSAAKYISVNGKPAQITKSGILESSSTVHTKPNVTKPPHYSFVTDEPFVIKARKPVTSKKAKTSKKDSYVGGVTVRGITYKNISRAAKALNLTQGQFYRVSRMGFSSEDAFEIILRNLEIEEQFPLTIKGRKYARPSTAVTNNHLTMDDYYKTLLTHGVMPFVDLLSISFELKHAKKLDLEVKLAHKSQTKVFTLEQLDILKSMNYPITDAVILRQSGKTFEVILHELSQYINLRGRWYKTLEAVARHRRIDFVLLDKFYSDTNNIEYSIKAVKEIMNRNKQDNKTKQAYKKREKKIKFSLFGVDYTSKVTAAKDLGVTFLWLKTQLESGKTESEIENMFYDFDDSRYTNLYEIADLLKVDRKFFYSLVDKFGYAKAVSLLSESKPDEETVIDNRFLVQLIKHVGHKTAFSLLAESLDESA